MATTRTKPRTIPEYIRSAPPEAQPTLKELYAILKSVAPDAKEAIKWGYPVFEEKRILFSFSAHKGHANFFPTRSALEPFRKELEGHKTWKDTIQLPYGKPVPKPLIRKIARYRAKDVRENDARWM